MISSEEGWPLQGEYIDFRDKDNNPWQVGYVINKAKNILKVRSEGWSSKFDEVSLSYLVHHCLQHNSHQTFSHYRTWIYGSSQKSSSALALEIFSRNTARAPFAVFKLHSRTHLENCQRNQTVFVRTALFLVGLPPHP